MSSLLGTPTEEFNCNKLRQLYEKAQTREELNSAKAYLLGYFARGKIGVYKWTPDLKIFEYYSKRMHAIHLFNKTGMKTILTFKNGSLEKRLSSLLTLIQQNH